MIIVGVDPGISGAIAAIDTDRNTVEVYDIEHSLVDGIQAIKHLRDENTGRIGAVIEKVASRPGQGVSSTFKFGRTYGHLRGAIIALEIPLLAEPSPQVWKRGVFGAGISKLDKKSQKIAARDKARELYPQTADMLKRVKDADRAEAILMAHFGRSKA